MYGHRRKWNDMVSYYGLAKKFYKAYRMNKFDMMKDTAQITKEILKGILILNFEENHGVCDISLM